MKSITIKHLTSELNDDYLDFFDNRAFTDDNPNGPCYCTSPNQDEETIRKMVRLLCVEYCRGSYPLGWLLFVLKIDKLVYWL